MDAVSIILQFFFNRQRTVLMGLTLSCRAQSRLTLSLLPVTLDAILKEGIMRANLSAPRRLSFGAFEADLHSGELLKYGNRVRLQAKPFQLLVMLLEHPGELVNREEICSRLWTADTF